MLREIAGSNPLYSFLDPGMLGDLYLPFVASRTPSVELRGQPETAAKSALLLCSPAAASSYVAAA
eukprot:6172063-Pleurochrysis_carterae.AAC.1